ncbi:MAG: GyrI-like domain-containing protein, partial [Cyanobacteria bacterium P01_F01_bin.143]
MLNSEKVVIKSVESQWVVASLGVIPNYQNSATILERLFTETYRYAQENNAEIMGSATCIYHDNKIRESNIPVEIIAPISQEITANEEVWVYKLPEVSNIASIVHEGSFETIEKVYDTLEQWIKKNQYKINGSLREIYLN